MKVRSDFPHPTLIPHDDPTELKHRPCCAFDAYAGSWGKKSIKRDVCLVAEKHRHTSSMKTSHTSPHPTPLATRLNASRRAANFFWVLPAGGGLRGLRHRGIRVVRGPFKIGLLFTFGEKHSGFRIRIHRAGKDRQQSGPGEHLRCLVADRGSMGPRRLSGSEARRTRQGMAVRPRRCIALALRACR